MTQFFRNIYIQSRPTSRSDNAGGFGWYFLERLPRTLRSALVARPTRTAFQSRVLFAALMLCLSVLVHGPISQMKLKKQWYCGATWCMFGNFTNKHSENCTILACARCTTKGAAAYLLLLFALFSPINSSVILSPSAWLDESLARPKSMRHQPAINSRSIKAPYDEDKEKPTSFTEGWPNCSFGNYSTIADLAAQARFWRSGNQCNTF